MWHYCQQYRRTLCVYNWLDSAPLYASSVRPSNPDSAVIRQSIAEGARIQLQSYMHGTRVRNSIQSGILRILFRRVKGCNMSQIQLHGMHNGGGALVAKVVVVCGCAVDVPQGPIQSMETLAINMLVLRITSGELRLGVCGESLMTSSCIDRLPL